MKLKKYDSINVIPFIVLLVSLAIVLMISTFISKGIIPISLPKASNSDTLKIDKEITISIKNDGTIFCDKEEKGLKDIENCILKFSKNTPVLINSDKNAKFELFVDVLDKLKKHEYSNISIVTKND